MGSVSTATELPETLAGAAAAYAVLGWRVFPLVPGGKVPRFRRAHADDAEQAACPGGQVCGRLGHGFKDATADVERVARWWARDPRCNIGIATGSPGGPGTSSPDVLDVDVKGGAPGKVSFGRLREVGLTTGAFAAVVTPSGGWHFYYDGTGQQSACLKKHGIDFRSCGGYVAAPCSQVGPLFYRWSWFDLAKDGLLSWLDVRDFLNPPPPPRDLTQTAFTDHAEPLIRWFAQQTAGNRNESLYWAACRILESGYGTDRLGDLRSEAILSGLGDAEVRKTIASATGKILGGGV